MGYRLPIVNRSADYGLKDALINSVKLVAICFIAYIIIRFIIWAVRKSKKP